MKKILKYALAFVVVVAVIDFLGFTGWALSGQLPPDGFYAGAITWNLIHAVVGINLWSVYPYFLFAWIFLAPVVCAFVAWHLAQREAHSIKSDIVGDIQQVLDVLAATDVLLANSVTDIYKTLKNPPTKVVVIGGHGGGGGGKAPNPKVKKVHIKSKRV